MNISEVKKIGGKILVSFSEADFQVTKSLPDNSFAIPRFVLKAREAERDYLYSKYGEKWNEHLKNREFWDITNITDEESALIAKFKVEARLV